MGSFQKSSHTVNMQAFITLALVAAASAAPQYAAAPVVHAVAAPDLAEPSPYTYTYAVADDYSKANFQQSESNDGTGAVTGSYSVNLPTAGSRPSPTTPTTSLATLLRSPTPVRPSIPLPLLVATLLLPLWLLTPSTLPPLSTLCTLLPLLPTPPTALLPTAKPLMKDCLFCAGQIFNYLFI